MSKIERFPHLISINTEKVRDIKEWRNDAKNYTRYLGKSKKTSAEAHLLYRLSREVGAGNRADIGVLYGHSTAVMAHGLQDSGELGCIYSVDLFGNLGENLHLVPNKLKNYIEEQQLDKVQLHICKGDSSTWGWKLTCPFKLVFIDGDHSESSVRKDFFAWGRLVEKGGYVVFHDTHFNSVDKIIQEIDLEKWEFVRQIYSTKVFRRK